MQTRREMLARSATVAGLLATAGFLPTSALAAWPQAAFDAKNLADAVKALYQDMAARHRARFRSIHVRFRYD